MSKYEILWKYIRDQGSPTLTLTFDEVRNIAGSPFDHSFLKYKKSCPSTASRSVKSQ